MQQVLSVWHSLDTRRRVIVAGATVAVFVAVLALGGIASRPATALLYAGLDGAQAGEVIAALDQRGAAYEVRGSAIYVDAAERDQLRMVLASEGLPAAGGAGYELLDSLSGFGTTSQMFDAAYWRAKEGELARTIVASPLIREARVHIATQSGQPFRRELRPTASVAVTTAGGGLGPAHAKALKYLVASAVAGMTPEDVSIIDGAGGLVLSGEEAGPAAGAESRAEEMRRNVERLLEARVGYGNAVVEVSVETVTEREAITERRFDPEGRVAISTDSEETMASATDSAAGAVTVASNLPEGDAGAGAGQSQSRNSETRERINYEVSETMREVLRAPGAIRRITVAVLVDAVTTTDASGQPVQEPRPEEELAALRDLVASAVGYDEARGDLITLKSMPFTPLAEPGTGPGGSLLDGAGLDLMGLVQLAVLALVALVLGLFVLRPILTGRSARRLPELSPPAPVPGGSPALTGEIDDGDFPAAALPVVSGPAPGRVPADLAAGRQEDDPVARLRRLIAERQAESVEILRGWMEDRKESA